MEDLHNTWPHRWITPKTKPQKSSIHGTGMFAIKPIKKDEAVAVYGGIIIPKSDLDKYLKKMGSIRGIQISKDFFICATEMKGGLFNHSCEPNLGYKNTIIIVAITGSEKFAMRAFKFMTYLILGSLVLMMLGWFFCGFLGFEKLVF